MDHADQPGELLFVGTATTVLTVGPFRLLTDPNFLHRGEQVHLGYGVRATRVREPARQPADLPPLDAVLLSHLHADHWDHVAARELPRELPVFTTPAGARTLRGDGFGAARGLRTWEQARLGTGPETLTVTAVPAQHAPGPFRRLLPPVHGHVLEYRAAPGEPALRIYVTGDTLLIPALDEIPRRWPDLDLTVMHLGGTRLPRRFGRVKVSMDGRDGAEYAARLGHGAVVPVHVDDYDRFLSPLSEFLDAARDRGVADRVRVVERGHTLPLTRWTPPAPPA